MAIHDQLQQNLNAVQDQIHSACRRANRSVDAVRLIAVTKYAEWSWVESLNSLHHTFGENRPQQLAERQVLLPNAEWHLIGQLQRNKVKLALQHACLVHSVDSLRLLERIAQVAAELQIRPRVLIEANMSQESAKSGFAAEELKRQWSEIVALHDVVQIDGLMTMAAESDNPEAARPVFRSLRILRDELQTTDASRKAGLTLPELSMGMSGDFVPAIEEARQWCGSEVGSLPAVVHRVPEMKPFAEADANPYAPPETAPVEKNPFHSSFQIFGEGVLCRSGLVLPELDLVTGASLADDAVPMRFDLKAPSSLNRTVQKISFVLFLLIPSIMSGLIYLRHSTQPRFSGRIDGWMLACRGLTAAFGLTCALAPWMAPRVLIVGHVTRRRSRWMAILRYFNLAWLVLIFLPAPYPANNIVRLSLFGGVVLFVLVIHPVLTRTIFAGMSLHARPADEHQVVVTGFSSVFLEKIGLYAEEKNRPARETTAALRNS